MKADHLEPRYRPPLEDCSHDRPEYARRIVRPPRELWRTPPALLGFMIGAACVVIPWIALYVFLT